MALSESQFYYDFENDKVFLPVQVAKFNVGFHNLFFITFGSYQQPLRQGKACEQVWIGSEKPSGKQYDQFSQQMPGFFVRRFPA
jgi:hypothetical protein